VQPGTTLAEYVASGPVSGIVVLHHGRIAFERYPRMRPGDRHLLMSVTKAFTSALVGILELRGVLDLRQPVEAVIGELAGTAWAAIAIDDVLAMASGIDCREIDTPGAYSDPGHPYYQFEATLGWRPAGGGPLRSPQEFVAVLPAHRPPGEAYEYTGVNTFLLSWLVAQAPVITAEHLRRIQAGGRPALHRDPGPLPGYVTTAYGPRLPPAARQPPVELRHRRRRPVQGRLRRAGALRLARPRPRHRLHRDPRRGWLAQPAALVQPPPGPGHRLTPGPGGITAAGQSAVPSAG
jgi:hypothetical protein